MSFLEEAAFAHGAVARSAVLLVNLGTPEAPQAGPVRRYLREFLSDPRVIEIPRAIWKPILHGVILNLRPRASAAKYAKIWTPEGSPLRVYSERQATLLRGYLGERGMDVDVALAMRYGEPSIEKVLGDLRARHVERLLVLPLYPQYSATSTATVFDEVHRVLARTRNLPEVRWVKHFHDHPRYIAALRDSVAAYWAKFGRATDSGGKLLMSFHGVPRRTLDLGDPYHCECLKTGRLLGEALGLSKDQFTVTFQSRFGRAQWLQPYTAPTLRDLGRMSGRVDVLCPGFVADCLETLEEIAIEGKHEFLTAGGKEFHYIGCVNDAPQFIHTLADIVTEHTQGWPRDRSKRAEREADVQASAARAKLAGAPL